MEYFEETRQKIIHTREQTKRELAALGFQFEDSMSNFIFAAHPTVRAEKIFEELKKKDIYVRHFKKPERISNYLRISIGTEEEMKEFLNSLKIILAKERG